MMVYNPQWGPTSRDEVARRAHLAEIVHVSADAILSADAAGFVVSANQAAERMFGYSMEEFASMHVATLAPPENSDVAADCLTRLARGERLVEAEVECRRKDGTVFPTMLTASPMLDRDGKMAGCSAILHDITDVKGARQALEHLLNLSPQMIAAFDRDGRFRQLNAAWERSLGHSIDELRGQPFMSLVHPDDVDATRQAFQKILAEEVASGFANRQRTRSGDYRSVEWKGSFDSASGLVYAVGRDDTERLSLERQLNQAQKMEAVGRLAGGVAHDFNNLLTAILGFAQLSLDALAADDPRRADMQEILKAGCSATRLTSRLLAFSRRQIVRPEVLDINAAIIDVHGLLCRVIGEDITLKIQLEDRCCYVSADRGQLEQVLMNLAVNSRDAMPYGGTLAISTRLAGGAVAMTVRDSGAGMPPDVLAHLFEPFYTTKPNGTGLGLATVYGIVTQSGGSIGVDSSPGQGTTFTIELPEVGAPVETASTGTAPPIAAGAASTVLIVEDQLEVRGISRRILVAQGYRVLEADGGQSALTIVGAHPGVIDLMLTDVVMPSMNGRQLAEAVSLLDSSIRVLFMSGYTDDQIVRDGVLEGEMEFIRKPFTPKELAARVAQVLGRPWQATT